MHSKDRPKVRDRPKGVCLKLRGECIFKNFIRAQMSTFTHSDKKATELPCLGILKNGNYDLTIRWLYVLSIDTPTSVRAQPERHELAVTRINRLSWRNGWKERACAVRATIRRCFRVWNPLKQRGTLKKKGGGSTTTNYRNSTEKE